VTNAIESPAASGKIETGAERQRRIFREKGDWKLLVNDMTERLNDDLKRHAVILSSGGMPQASTPKTVAAD